MDAKKKSDLVVYTVIFFAVLLFIVFLPNINSLLKGNGWFKNGGDTTEQNTTEEETPAKVVANQKSVTWFQNYVEPLYRAGFFGNYTSNKPNTGTKETSDDNLLEFAFINTMGIDENLMSGKYDLVNVEDEDTDIEGSNIISYAVVPEKEIKSLIKQYFGVTFTYKPTKSKTNKIQYYDKTKKAYLRQVMTLVGTAEQYNITSVVYKEYNITLTYTTTINGLECSSDYANENITTGTGKLKLYYDNGNYIYKSNSYTADTKYTKCWEE